MILILASLFDRAALNFAMELGDKSALLTCLDLAQNGLQIHDPKFEESSIFVQDRWVNVSEIRAVINCLSTISMDELPCYAPEERQYQSAEFHALLVHLLTALSCPVLGRSTTLSLCGPALNPLDWMHLAIEAGLELLPARITSDNLADSQSTHPEKIKLICLAGRLLNPCYNALDQAIVQLAEYLQLDYLQASFITNVDGNVYFVDASAKPDLNNPLVCSAIRDSFLP